jgi:serine/threonine protein kinase
VRNKSNGRKYAAKKICKFDKNNKSTKKIVAEERKILNQLSGNRHVSKFMELYEDNNEFVLVLEHIEGKDLLNFIKESPDLSVESIKQVIISVLQCLRALHS